MTSIHVLAERVGGKTRPPYVKEVINHRACRGRAALRQGRDVVEGQVQPIIVRIRLPGAQPGIKGSEDAAPFALSWAPRFHNETASVTPTNPSVLPSRDYAAFLFDMDGTILTSIKSAERVWSAWALRHGLDPVTFVPTVHGKRTEDTIRQLGLPGVDPVAEALGIALAEIEDVGDIEEIAGVGRFLASLPTDRWAIVTSASRALATARIAAAGLPLPPLLVSADDVKRGKPNPDPFLLGAQKLGVAPQDCLVFEDTTIGLAAAESAGMDSLIVTATHVHPVETHAAPIPDYTDLMVVATESGRLRVQRRIGH